MPKKGLFQRRNKSLFEMNKKELLQCILRELGNVHYHLDRLEAFYMMVNNIKEDGKTGAWVDHNDGHRDEKKSSIPEVE